MKIGEESTIYVPTKTQIDTTRPWLIDIGKNVKITEGVTILTHGFDWSVLKGVYGDILGSSGGVKIGDNVFIGMQTTILKGVHAVCLEGSLKLKEISYIHSEAYAAGELKHGTISLIEQGTLVIGVLTQSELYEKTISNMLECKSRGAYLMGLTTYGKYEIEDQVNFTVYVPKVDEHFVGSLAVIPLQLLGYYVSVAKGLDVDKPRNLAKSVTVE